MVEEQPIGHEVAGVQDDGRQHVQKKGIGGQRWHVDAARLEQQEADNHADGDQQAGLREDLVELRRHVEAWTLNVKRRVKCHIFVIGKTREPDSYRVPNSDAAYWEKKSC